MYACKLYCYNFDELELNMGSLIWFYNISLNINIGLEKTIDCKMTS